MQWWQKSLLAISGVSGFFVAFTTYNQYYEDRGQVHPITAFIARHTCDEEEDRRKRIDDVQAQADLSDLRLRSMHRLKPKQGDRLGKMAEEEPEDIDQFLYGDEADMLQHIVTTETVPEVEDEPAKNAGDDQQEMEDESMPVAALEKEEGEEEEEENEDYEDDDLEIVYERSSAPAKRGLTQVSMPAAIGSLPGSAAATATNKPSVDVNAPGMLNGEIIYNVELDSLPEKPWRMPGADITDYFNYGFTENTWREYCLRQKNIRDELGTQKRIAVFDGSAAGPITLPPGMPPMPFMPPPPLPGAVPGMPPFPFPPPPGGLPGAFPFPPPPPFMFPGMPPLPPPPIVEQGKGDANAAVTPPEKEKDSGKDRERDRERDREKEREKEKESSSRRSGSRRDRRSPSRSRSRERDSKSRRR